MGIYKIESKTTTRPDIDLAVKIGKTIKSKPSLPQEAQQHVDQATKFRNQAEELANNEKWLDVAEASTDALREYSIAQTHTPPNNTNRLKQLGIDAADQVKTAVAFEMIGYSREHLDKDALDVISRTDIRQFASFAAMFRKLENWRKVIQKPKNLLSHLPPLTGQTEEELRNQKTQLYENQIKGTLHHINVARDLGQELVVDFEQRHHTQEEQGAPGTVDIVVRGNIAVECKNYKNATLENSTALEKIANQAISRLQPDIDTKHEFDETIIVLSDDINYQKAVKNIEGKIPDKFRGRIKIWTISMLNNMKKQGYFNK